MRNREIEADSSADEEQHTACDQGRKQAVIGRGLVLPFLLTRPLFSSSSSRSVASSSSAGREIRLARSADGRRGWTLCAEDSSSSAAAFARLTGTGADTLKHSRHLLFHRTVLPDSMPAVDLRVAEQCGQVNCFSSIDHSFGPRIWPEVQVYDPGWNSILLPHYLFVKIVRNHGSGVDSANRFPTFLYAANPPRQQGHPTRGTSTVRRAEQQDAGVAQSRNQAV